MAHILHAAFTADRFHFWAESVDRWRLVSEGGAPRATSEPTDQAFPWHPYGTRRAELAPCLGPVADSGRDDECVLRLPRDLLGPFPSDRLAASVGGVDRSGEPWLARFRIATRSLSPVQGLRFLLAVASGDIQLSEEPGHDLLFWADAARLVADRCETQRFVPSMRQGPEGQLYAMWRPWLQDDEAAARLTGLLATMPPVTRGVDDALGEDAWPRLESAIEAMTDDLVRAMLRREDFIQAIDERDPADPHVQWLGGLLGGSRYSPSKAETP